MTVDKKPRRKCKSKVDPKWHWNAEHQQTFEILKEKLSSPPVLSYSDFSKHGWLSNRTGCSAIPGAGWVRQGDSIFKQVE